MRKPLVVAFCFLMTCTFLGACAKDRYQRVEARDSFFSTDAGDRPYLKQAAFVPKQGLTTQFGSRIEALFLQSLIDTMRTEAKHLALATPLDEGFPPLFLNGDDLSSSGQASRIAEKARMLGYHYMVQAGVWHAEPVKEKKGFWFFRKERGYVNLVVALDVYDTLTGAKIVSRVIDDNVRIPFGEYEGLMTGLQGAVAEVDEAATDYGEELGDLAADAMMEGRWMTPVIAVEDGHVVLAAGRAAGLREGDRLAIFEGRRIINGLNGENYIAPGYKLSDIRIVTAGETNARAVMDQPADIKPGDIVLPVR